MDSVSALGPISVPSEIQIELKAQLYEQSSTLCWLKNFIWEKPSSKEQLKVQMRIPGDIFHCIFSFCSIKDICCFAYVSKCAKKIVDFLPVWTTLAVALNPHLQKIEGKTWKEVYQDEVMLTSYQGNTEYKVLVLQNNGWRPNTEWMADFKINLAVANIAHIKKMFCRKYPNIKKVKIFMCQCMPFGQNTDPDYDKFTKIKEVMDSSSKFFHLVLNC